MLNFRVMAVRDISKNIYLSRDIKPFKAGNELIKKLKYYEKCLFNQLR